MIKRIISKSAISARAVVSAYCSREYSIKHIKAHEEMRNFVKYLRAGIAEIDARLSDPSSLLRRRAQEMVSA